jgi:hypothetical protein
MKEIWQNIVGYENKYQGCELGIIRNTVNCFGNPKIKILKPHKTGNGYFQVQLYKNGSCKYLLIHRIIAELFIPNPLNLPCVNHIDKNKSNNNVSNLEWVTASQNEQHRHKTRDNYKDDYIIPTVEFSRKDFAKINNLTRVTDWNVINRLISQNKIKISRILNPIDSHWANTYLYTKND